MGPYGAITKGIKSFLSTIGAINEDDKDGTIKLEAHKINKFSGNPEDWPRWKSGTRVTLMATG